MSKERGSNPNTEGKDEPQPEHLPSKTISSVNEPSQQFKENQEQENSSNSNQNQTLNANTGQPELKENIATPSLTEEEQAATLDEKNSKKQHFLHKEISKGDQKPSSSFPSKNDKQNNSSVQPSGCGFKRLFQRIPESSTSEEAKNPSQNLKEYQFNKYILTLQEEQENKGNLNLENQRYQPQYQPRQKEEQSIFLGRQKITSLSVFSNIPVDTRTSFQGNLPWKTKQLTIPLVSIDQNQRKNQENTAMNIEDHPRTEGKDTVERPNSMPIAMNLFSELQMGGEKLAKYLSSPSFQDEGDANEAEDGDGEHEDQQITTHKNSRISKKDFELLEQKGSKQFPQFLLGARGEEKSTKKGIHWLSGIKSLPLLRDYESASRIFAVIRARNEELGANNCFLNLTYALLEMIQASEDSRLWNSFRIMVRDMHNPDLEEYIKYIFARDEGKSFHIGQIDNACYDSLSRSGRVPSYLTLFRLQYCKRQLARCLIIFFQRMLSSRYWCNAMSYKDDKLYSPAETFDESFPKANNKIPTLKELFQQDEKIASSLSSFSKKKFDKDAPSCFIHNPRGALDPLKERQFWLNHYIFNTQVNNNNDEGTKEEKEKEYLASDSHQHQSLSQEEQRASNKFPTPTQQDGDDSNISTKETKPDDTNPTGTEGKNPPKQTVVVGDKNQIIEEEAEDNNYLFESAASKAVPYKILDPPPEMMTNLEKNQQDLHIINLLQEFCEQQEVSTKDLGLGLDLESNASKQDPQFLPMSYMSCCAALGQIRLTQGLNQVQTINPENGRVVYHNSPTSDVFDLTSDIHTDAKLSLPTKRGVILKSMNVELNLIGKDMPLPLEQEQDVVIKEDHSITTNLSYHFVDRKFQPYVMLDREKNYLGQLSPYIPPTAFPSSSSIQDFLTTPGQQGDNLPHQNTLIQSIHLMDQMEKNETMATSLISQYFNHDGFLFCQPTLNLKNLQPDHSWKLGFKWECLEGSQNILSCYILSAYLHALVHKSYCLHYSNLRKDSDSGNQVAKQLLKNLTLSSSTSD